MSLALDKLRQEAYDLPLPEKTELIDFLLMSIHNTPTLEVEEAWKTELAARLKAVEEGRAKLIPWEQVKAKYDEYFEKNRAIFT